MISVFLLVLPSRPKTSWGLFFFIVMHFYRLVTSSLLRWLSSSIVAYAFRLQLHPSNPHPRLLVWTRIIYSPSACMHTHACVYCGRRGAAELKNRLLIVWLRAISVCLLVWLHSCDASLSRGSRGAHIWGGQSGRKEWGM